MRELTPADLADEGIGLFLEYRDSYGYDEDRARASAINEVVEAEHARIELAQEAPCGRPMVGSGTDTYDPTCDLIAGHSGPCRSRSAIDQHRLVDTPPWAASTDAAHPAHRGEMPDQVRLRQSDRSAEVDEGPGHAADCPEEPASFEPSWRIWVCKCPGQLRPERPGHYTCAQCGALITEITVYKGPWK
jgi:hypothetical protein